MNENQTIELAELSTEQTSETKGAWVPLGARAGYGAISGGVSHSVSNYGTGNFSWSKLAASVGAGAVGGSFGVNAGTAATIGAGSSALIKRVGDSQLHR